MLIAAALAIIGVVTALYIAQLNKAISENIIGSISEIAEHDKTTIQTHIDSCWGDLYEIQDRFTSADCKTIQDIEIQMNLERASSGFTHIYILAEDGTKELLYFIPLSEDTEMYFIMSVTDEVFREQTQAFTTMSMTMLAVSMVTIVSMLLIMMRNQNKAIRATEKERLQKEFLSIMSHEIRTPLNVLLGLNHLIKAYIDD